MAIILQSIFIAIIISILLICGFRLYHALSLFIRVKKQIFWIIYGIIQIIFTCFFAMELKAFAYISTLWFIFTVMFALISFSADKLLKILKKDLSSNIKKTIEFSIISFIIIFTLVGIHTANDIKVTTYSLSTDKLKEQLSIVVVSDAHLGALTSDNKADEIVDIILSLKPDIVLLPGDFFDSSLNNVSDLNIVRNALLKVDVPIYAIFGNHEKKEEYEQIEDFFQSANVILLDDEIIELENITIIGRKDKQITEINNDFRLSISDFVYDEEKYIIMLDHEPNDIDSVKETDIDLLISGHTHNGQVFPANLLLKVLMDISYGYKNFDDTDVIVTSGVGYTRLPIRVFTKSEIVNIIIN